MKTMTFSRNPAVGSTNELLYINETDYLSFNANPCASMGSFFRADGGGAETALCAKIDGSEVWMILNGDHRAAYTEAAPKGVSACVELYLKLKSGNASTWSTDECGEVEHLTRWLAARMGAIT